MSEKRKIPKLRFLEFTDQTLNSPPPEENLSEKRLMDIIQEGRKIRYGIVQPGVYDPEGRLMIRGQDYSESKGWAEPSEFFRVSDEVEKKYRKARVRAGDLLITIVGAGTGWFEEVPVFLDGANITQTTGRIAVNPEIASSGFVKNYFKSVHGRKEISKYIKGQAQPGLNIGDIELFKLMVPSITEQQKIAEFLTAVDKRIELLQAKKEKLEAYKKGAMQQIFSQKLRFKADDGSDFPDWEEKKLGDLGEFYGGGTPSSSNEEFWTGSTPWISSSDIAEDSIFSISKTRFISDAAITQSATKVVPAKSILVVTRVGVGKIGYSEESVCTSQDFTNISPSENLDPIFLAYRLHNMTSKIKGLSQGTSIKGITMDDVKNLKLTYPVKAEQTKIVKFLTSLDSSIETLEKQINHTQTWKKGLLQKMFV